MKDCCKPEEEKTRNKSSKLMRWLMYAVVIGLLAFILIEQFNY